MASQVLGAEEFDVLIREHDLVFVYFWAEWCAPCKQFAAVYEQAANANPGVVFAKVNIEEQLALSQLFGILSIPHLLVFKQGTVIYSDVGGMPESALKELVSQAWEVDLETLRETTDRA